MTLRGRTILVTREKERSLEMVREIEARGGKAVVVPMIATGPPVSWDECDRAIARLDEFDLLVFTSVTAVEMFVGRTRVLGVPPAALSRARSAAVGDATASALEACGVPVAYVPAEFTGASLGSSLGGSLPGKRVLIPRGNIARREVAETLREQGAAVETVTVYVTTRPEGIDGPRFAPRVLAGEFDVVTFASPSAAENFVSFFGPRELGAVADHARIAAIGPSTADAVRALGLPADIIARQSNASGLITSIEEFYRGAR